MNVIYENSKSSKLNLKELPADKNVPIHKLSEGNLRHNIQFLQWYQEVLNTGYKENQFDSITVYINHQMTHRASDRQSPTATTKQEIQIGRPTLKLNSVKNCFDASSSVNECYNLKAQGRNIMTQGHSSTYKAGSIKPNKVVIGSKAEQDRPVGILKNCAVKPAASETLLRNELMEMLCELDDMNKQIEKCKLRISKLRKERDFYFRKLRHIEVMCQYDDQNYLPVEQILDVLYATEEGFAPTNDMVGKSEDEAEYY